MSITSEINRVEKEIEEFANIINWDLKFSKEHYSEKGSCVGDVLRSLCWYVKGLEFAKSEADKMLQAQKKRIFELIKVYIDDESYKWIKDNVEEELTNQSQQENSKSQSSCFLPKLADTQTQEVEQDD